MWKSSDIRDELNCVGEIMQLRKVLLSDFLSDSTLKHESAAEPPAEVKSLVERDQRHPSPGLWLCVSRRWCSGMWHTPQVSHSLQAKGAHRSWGDSPISQTSYKRRGVFFCKNNPKLVKLKLPNSPVSASPRFLWDKSSIQFRKTVLNVKPSNWEDEYRFANLTRYKRSPVAETYGVQESFDLHHLLAALKAPATFHERIRSLERARVRRELIIALQIGSSKHSFPNTNGNTCSSHYRLGASRSTNCAADLSALSWSVCISSKVIILVWVLGLPDNRDE